MENFTTRNNTSSILSWLGFGISITLFLLIWVINILITSHDSKSLFPVYMLVIILGSILGVLAMIFSIVGLILAIKNNTPKWIGVSGISICILSLFSFFIPIFYNAMKDSEPLPVETPDSDTLSGPQYEKGVTIQIFSAGRIRCINDIDPENSIVGNMSSYDKDFNAQITNWLKMNNVDTSTPIKIIGTLDSSYSDVSKVTDVLDKMGITKYQLSSGLNPAEYYSPES